MEAGSEKPSTGDQNPSGSAVNTSASMLYFAPLLYVCPQDNSKTTLPISGKLCVYDAYDHVEVIKF